MLEPRWIEYLLVTLGFIDLLEAASVITSTAIVVLLRHHQWRRALSSFYVSAGLGVLSRFGLIRHLTAFRLFLLLLTLIFILIHPIARFPDLSGQYRISCITMRLSGVDARIFYPCIKPEREEQGIRYLEWESHTPVGMARYGKVPAFLLSHIPSFRLRAYREAPFYSELTDKCPLIMFSHGLGGTFEVYSSLIEEWASRGFIVVAVNHSDGSAAAYRLPDQSDLQLYEHPHESSLALEHRKLQLERRVDELRNALTAILQHREDALAFGSRIDPNRIFAVGHSFGAATAISAAHVDDRFRAAVAMDLWAQPVKSEVFSLKSRLQTIPVLHIVSSLWADSDYFRDFVNSTKDKSNVNIWVIEGARHASFSDLYLYSPILIKLLHKSNRPTAQVLTGVGRLTAEFLLDTLSEKEFSSDYSYFRKC